jgi:HAD superfamily hydrolase (TIGR01549 family)
MHFSFDLDGTLIDSLPLMRASWENCTNELGLQATWLEYRQQIGLPFKDICNNLGISDRYDEVREKYFSFNMQNIGLVEAMEGLADLLIFLGDNKISWSVITSKPRQTTTPILERFGLHPEIVITSTDVTMGKPHSQAGKVLKEAVEDSEIVYVGDSMVDHLFAINCGFYFVRCCFDGKEVLVKDREAYSQIKNPHQVAKTLGEVRSILAGWLS